MGQVDVLVIPMDQWLLHKEGEGAPVPGDDVYEMNLKDKTKTTTLIFLFLCILKGISRFKMHKTIFFSENQKKF